MSNISATRRAWAMESGEQQRLYWLPGLSGSPHSRSIRPTTSWPLLLSRAAATELSTPPDMATTTRDLDTRLLWDERRKTKDRLGHAKCLLTTAFWRLPVSRAYGRLPTCSNALS